MPDSNPTLQPHQLTATWRQGVGIVNLRGAADDAGFVAGATQTLGLALPLAACSTQAGMDAAAAGIDPGNSTGAVERIVWAGPDEWFVVAPAGRAGAIEQALRTS